MFNVLFGWFRKYECDDSGERTKYEIALEKERCESPNDPKLSDGGAWRGSCEGGAQKEAADVGQSHDRTRRVQARIAATVTRGAVRCSAWLGDCRFTRIDEYSGRN